MSARVPVPPCLPPARSAVRRVAGRELGEAIRSKITMRYWRLSALEAFLFLNVVILIIMRVIVGILSHFIGVLLAIATIGGALSTVQCICVLLSLCWSEPFGLVYLDLP